MVIGFAIKEGFGGINITFYIKWKDGLYGNNTRKELNEVK